MITLVFHLRLFFKNNVFVFMRNCQSVRCTEDIHTRPNTAGAQRRHRGGILASAVPLLCPQNESKQRAGIRYF
jgi:hypothetical protein